MPVVDVMGFGKKKAVMNDTWGHLYPDDSGKYEGKIWFATGGGSFNVLDRDFGELPGSPMEYELVGTIDRYLKVDWDVVALYEVSCTLHFFKGFEDKFYGNEPYGRILKVKAKKISKPV